EPLDPPVHEATPGPGLPDGIDPEQEALLADSVGPALLVVLETLAPAERLAFVLHDMFAVPFDEIATIVGRSPAAARQLASRARPGGATGAHRRRGGADVGAGRAAEGRLRPHDRRRADRRHRPDPRPRPRRRPRRGAARRLTGASGAPAAETCSAEWRGRPPS